MALAGLALAGAAALGWPGQRAATTWLGLVAPLAPNAEVTAGYVLSEPRLEPNGHVVLVARRPADPRTGRASADVEIHVIPRGEWPGVRETRTFGVGYEVPRTSAPAAERDRVVDAVARAIRAHDTGFDRPATIPIGEPGKPPLVAQVVAAVSGWRGALFVTCLVLALSLLASLRSGALWAALSLFAIGLGLRLPALDLPFVRDQDIQRLFTSQRTLWDIFTGAGLEDRHPPLYFALLHVVTWGHTSEQAARLPAAISGALLAPALVLAAFALRDRSVVCASVAALACAISPLLVVQSREVSELPLFGVTCVLLVVALARSIEQPRRASTGAVAAAHAVSLWLYYLAPFVALGAWLGLAASRRSGRMPWRAAVVGTVVGLPALAIGATVFLADRGARQAAERFPTVAWGSHSPLEMLGYAHAQLVDGFGAPLLVAAALAAVVAAVRRRDTAVLAALGAFVVTLAGLVALTPFARVQPYYVGGFVPLLFLAAALSPAPGVSSSASARFERFAIAAALSAGLVVLGATRIAPLRAAYAPDPLAFGPRFARAIVARPERTVLCVASYDATTLAYYVGRATGEPVDWIRGAADPGWRIGGKSIVPLVFAHRLTAASVDGAVRDTRAALERGPTLVVVRDRATLPAVLALLASCERLETTPDARLLRCDGAVR